MKIEKNTVVTISLKVTTLDPQLNSNKEETVSFLFGHNGVLPKVEAALERQEKGFRVTTSIEPKDGLGEVDESKKRTINKSDFPPGIKLGGTVALPDASGHEINYMVVKIKGPQVFLDANHPLAGHTFTVDAKVLDVRAATPDEITHGHAHGAHGHHH